MQRNKQKINATQLYSTNAKSTLFKPYATLFDFSRSATPHELKGIAIAIVLHTACLPLSTTIGAGIKTFIDFKTRHPLSESEMASLLNLIATMKDDAFDKLIEHMLQYKAKSNASATLLEGLKKNDIKDCTDALLTTRREEQRAAIIKYLNDEKNIGKKMQHVILENTNRLGR